MDSQLFNIIERFESSFSRKATYHCFTLLIIGLIVRGDHYGLSSIVRWLSLMSSNYWQILNFFNSTGWSLPGILLCWWSYCLEEAPCLMVQGRYVVIGDHTNQPKEGQRMPEVITIHQNSETSSKPGYFRGHIWAFIGLVIEKAQKYYAVPLLGEMNIEKRNNENSQSMGTRIVYNALSIAKQMDCCIYLVLDAFFAIGPVFLAASVYSIALRTPLVHIITRAKKSTVAYLDPEPDPPGKRGRKKQYGEKIKLKKIFEQRSDDFSKAVVLCLWTYGNHKDIMP